MSSALLNRPRASLAKAVRLRVAGSEFESAHAKIFHAEGERWFTPGDAIWQVHSDTSMFVGGITALLFQSLHPVAMLGVSEHSGYRGDPWGRLQRTSTYLATTTYGTAADAERSIAIVRAIHRRVRGTDPQGQPYRADDSALLRWVHLAQVESFLRAYQVYGGTPLTRATTDEYLRQTGQVAGRLGVVDPPRSRAELDRQLASYRPLLRATAGAREAAHLLLRDPPLAGPARVGYTILAAGAVAILPAWVRTELRLPSLPITNAVLTQPVTRKALRAIRWALAGEADLRDD